MIYWSEDRKFVEREFIRMGFDKDARWRISDINKDFELCNTYPKFLIIPSSFKDEDLESVAKFRYFRRIPTAVWRHIKNGCFIVRSSQPTVGWFGWFRNELDENLVQSYVSNTMPPYSEGNDNYNTKQNESVNDDALCDDQQTLVEDDQRKTPQNATIATTNSLPLQQLEQKLEQNYHNNNIEESNEVIQARGNGRTPATAPLTAASSATTASDNSDSNLNLGNGNDSETSTSLQFMTVPNVNGNGTTPLENNIITTPETNSTLTTSKMLIIDARSYTAAMANRAKGGGCECSEYYQRCEVQFMNLANIHSIRKSFHAIRSVCEAYSEQSNK